MFLSCNMCTNKIGKHTVVALYYNLLQMKYWATQSELKKSDQYESE